MKYWVLAYYHLTPLDSPEEEVLRHHAFFKEKDAAGRIYISKEGINGQMSALEKDAKSYISWLSEDPRFKGVEFKIHTHHENVFPRMTVKVREQLVAMDRAVDLKNTGEHLSAEGWDQMLRERDEDTVLIDVRNAYEWKIGHFEDADLPPLETFREFPDYVDKLKTERDPEKTKVMMYCTGGIRCEFYSALLKQEGFEKVYQLDGGIIKYGLQEKGDLWKGKLFVFDDRLSIPIHPDKTEIISTCQSCGEKTDLYYNCANMDCNELFLSCLPCAEKNLGCCCEACKVAPRVRAFQKQERPKPFRRKHLAESGN